MSKEILLLLVSDVTGQPDLADGKGDTMASLKRPLEPGGVTHSYNPRDSGD